MTLREYYRSVRPFYAAEMARRTDVPEWTALARRLAPRSVLDLGCGGGRMGAAMKAAGPAIDVVGIDLLDVLVDTPPAIPFARADMRALPFGPRFDLVVAANDPFTHLLDGGDRERAMREARRVLAAGGRVVIDGLWVPHPEPAFTKIRELDGGIRLTESWRAVGDDVYDTRYTYRRGEAVLAEASTRVRAWRPDEAALRAVGAHLAGGLDGRPFDPAGDRIVIFVGGTP